MCKRIINIAAVTGTYIATLIGAGFASGQEVLQYFVKYGKGSIFAVGLVSVIFAVVSIAVTERCRSAEFEGFRGYLEAVMPHRIAVIVDILVFIVMLAVFCVMAAGCGATLAQICGLSQAVGVAILCAMCFLCLLFDVRAVLAVNGILAPIIVFGIVFVCIYILKFREINVFSADTGNFTENWLVSGISYASYNVLTAVVVLVGMSRGVKDSCEAGWIGVLSGVTFFVIMMLLWAVLKIYYGKIMLGEIPMLTLTLRMGGGFGAFYTVVLVLAMLTTALANGFGVTERIMGYTGLGRGIAAAMVCGVGFWGAGVGFERLVGEGYNICGYIGIILLIDIINNYIKIIKKREK